MRSRGCLALKTRLRPGGRPGLYGVVQAGTLPTRAGALEKAIVTRFEGGHSRPSATFVYAATFLNAGSSAALRAALYRVIESLPGVQNLGPATDRLGRHGQAVGLVTGGTREVLIFDPASTVVLEREMVAVPPRQSGNNMLPAGTVTAVHGVPPGGRGRLGHRDPPPRPAPGRASAAARRRAPPRQAMTWRGVRPAARRLGRR